MAKIAISYRREDTAGITGRIFDRLQAHYGKGRNTELPEQPVIFLDYDSTPVGTDFRRHIKSVLDNCDILLAVIGPQWKGDDGAGKPRIMRETDWVRIEIEAALKRDIPVVPVLIDRTPMPTANVLPTELHDLLYRQAAIVDSQIDFNTHMQRLIREIDRTLGSKHDTASSAPPKAPEYDRNYAAPRQKFAVAEKRSALSYLAQFIAYFALVLAGGLVILLLGYALSRGMPNPLR